MAPKVLLERLTDKKLQLNIEIRRWNESEDSKIMTAKVSKNSEWRNPELVADAAQRIYMASKEVRKKTSKLSKPILTIGGDHSIAIGTISSSTSHYGIENVVVLWIDAHADINTRKTTPSGNIHGCPVSFLIGHPDSPYENYFSWLSDDGKLKQRLMPENLIYIGLRDVDPGEIEILNKYNIRCYFMDEIKRRRKNDRFGNKINPMDEIFGEIFEKIDPKRHKYFHISFDVDGLDPQVVPSTGTPVSDGLTFEEGNRIIQIARDTGRLAALDIVELNPLLGTEEERESSIKYTVKLIESAFSD